MKTIIKWVMALTALSLVFRFRYRLLNLLLGNQQIRSFGINTIMRIPGMEDRFLKSAFGSNN